jgi:hypothetical protein
MRHGVGRGGEGEDMQPPSQAFQAEDLLEDEGLGELGPGLD